MFGSALGLYELTSKRLVVIDDNNHLQNVKKAY